ncbi:S8 family serine peptidase [Halomonas sp. LBP4]|uniref:S8 family serine peptidase n=1 Tax=Halomonas sp. LBP4 TaxID=2044917 RepID=UPI0015E8A4DF|nr:S8 family serine peptidase [Halomonas sp. LBP4]
MTKPRYATLLALPAIAFLLTGCLGGGGGSTKSNDPDGVHEPAPAPESTSPSDNAETPSPDGAVVVGVADSGFRLTHETIEPHLLKATNLIDDSADVSGDEDHGTAIASLVTQAPSHTGLLLAKVSDDDNAGLAATNVLDYSVGYLATEGARVINHSWSGRIDAPDPAASYRGVNALTSLEQIISSNDGLGSVYVIAAGNDGQPLQSSNPIHQHAEIFERMLIVGGSTRDANDEVVLDPQSNHPGDDANWQSRFLTAPWDAVAATADGDDTYAYWGGTSVTAPQVAEFAAAIIERWPHLDAATVSKHLLDTADQSSPLFQDNTCGASGSANCGTYYMGQGEADILEALAPAGTLAVPTGNQVDGASVEAHQSMAELSGAYGDSLATSDALARVAAFDDLGRDYPIDLSGQSQPRQDRERTMRDHMARLSAASPEQRQQFDGTFGAFRFSATHNGRGETLASRLDGRMGASQWTAFHFAGDETDPLSPYGNSGMMPLLSYQGGSALTEGLDAVNGLRTEVPLGGQLALVAKHWAGDGRDETSAFDSTYQASRTDLGLRMALTDDIGLTSTVGVLNESQGLLGAQGHGALSLGERNRMTFGSVTLDATLAPRLRAFAHYDQGRGDAHPSGLIQRIEGIQAEEFGMGLQWTGDRHLAALGYRQPMRLDSATATLSVPVGRTLDGTVIRESRHASLSPSGRQQDIELGYTYLPSERSALQVNLVHTLEPGHDRDASPDTAAMVNYRVRF